MNIAMRIAELRKQKRMTQQELADYLECSRGRIANYEQGKREPDIKTLLRLADFFGISIDDLLTREPVRHKLIRLEQAAKGAYKLLLDEKELDEEEIREVIEYIRTSRAIEK